MDTTLIEHCNRALKDDPTGQRKSHLLLELESSKRAHIHCAERLEIMAKSFLAEARQLDLFIRLLELKEKEPTNEIQT